MSWLLVMIYLAGVVSTAADFAHDPDVTSRSTQIGLGLIWPAIEIVDAIGILMEWSDWTSGRP